MAALSPLNILKENGDAVKPEYCITHTEAASARNMGSTYESVYHKIVNLFREKRNQLGAIRSNNNLGMVAFLYTDANGKEQLHTEKVYISRGILPSEHGERVAWEAAKLTLQNKLTNINIKEIIVYSERSPCDLLATQAQHPREIVCVKFFNSLNAGYGGKIKFIYSISRSAYKEKYHKNAPAYVDAALGADLKMADGLDSQYKQLMLERMRQQEESKEKEVLQTTAATISTNTVTTTTPISPVPNVTTTISTTSSTVTPAAATAGASLPKSLPPQQLQQPQLRPLSQPAQSSQTSSKSSVPNVTATTSTASSTVTATTAPLPKPLPPQQVPPQPLAPQSQQYVQSLSVPVQQQLQVLEKKQINAAQNSSQQQIRTPSELEKAMDMQKQNQEFWMTLAKEEQLSRRGQKSLAYLQKQQKNLAAQVEGTDPRQYPALWHNVRYLNNVQIGIDQAQTFSLRQQQLYHDYAQIIPRNLQLISHEQGLYFCGYETQRQPFPQQQRQPLLLSELEKAMDMQKENQERWMLLSPEQRVTAEEQEHFADLTKQQKYLAVQLEKTDPQRQYAVLWEKMSYLSEKQKEVNETQEASARGPRLT